MFVISQSQTYVWPVSVETPSSGGKFEKHSFDAEFKRVSQSRLQEIVKGIESGDINDNAICREILSGWKGITDASGDELPFSESARDKLLDVQLVPASIVRAWFESIAGARRKN